MDDREVARYWDENAPEWTEAVRAGFDVYRDYVNNPAFFDLLGPVAGLRLLDVGCGEGTNTRKLAELGAQVVGVDVSEVMIAAARRQEGERRLGIEYHVASGNDLRCFGDKFFDGAVSTMALMDMADYAGCVREVARVVKPGGSFQFSVSHPCTMTALWRWIKDEEGRRLGVLVGNYFGLASGRPEDRVDEWFFGAAPPEVRARARKFRIPRFSRTLAEYFNTLTASDFVVERLTEPFADERAAEACPDVADTRIVPYFLVFRCRLGQGDGDSCRE